MKLLFDQNLSAQLPIRLKDIFPGSKHVRDFQLEDATDRRVCEAASDQGFVIVTQDEDFAELAYVLEFCPKVVWLTLGNASTQRRERTFRIQQEQIEAFGSDPLRRLFIID